MGFGHRDETSFDGVMRMAFCLDGDYERQVGRRGPAGDDRLELEVESRGRAAHRRRAGTVRRQVARVVSLDHDGDGVPPAVPGRPGAGRGPRRAPGFRPALFYSPYEAAVWSIISARRARGQGITLRTRLAEQYGAASTLAGERTLAVPTPSRLLAVESVPGLPADRIPRLHAVAEAAPAGRLAAERLRALPPEEAKAELQQLPGIGPFYSALIVIRACGHADVLAPRRANRARRSSGVRHRSRADRRRAGGDRRELATLPHLGHRHDAGAVGRSRSR